MPNQSFVGKVVVQSEDRKKQIKLDGDSSIIRADSISSHNRVQVINSSGRVVVDENSIKVQKADPEAERYDTLLEINGGTVRTDHLEPFQNGEIVVKSGLRIVDEDRKLETFLSPGLVYSKPTYDPARPTGEFKLEFEFKKIDGTFNDVYALYVDEIHVKRINPSMGGYNLLDTIDGMKKDIKDLQSQLDELKEQLSATP
jgi:hypothetical protein